MHHEAKEEKKGKMNCSNCNKEFSQPLLMADYSKPNQPDLVAHCTYCFKLLSSKQKSKTDKEAWKNMFNRAGFEVFSIGCVRFLGKLRV